MKCLDFYVVCSAKNDILFRKDACPTKLSFYMQSDKTGKLLGINYIDFRFLRSMQNVSFKIIVLGIWCVQSLRLKCDKPSKNLSRDQTAQKYICKVALLVMLVHVLYLGKQKIINVHYCFHFSTHLSVKFQNPQKKCQF